MPLEKFLCTYWLMHEHIIHPVLYPQDPKFSNSATPWTSCPVIIVGLPLKLHMQGRLIQAPSMYYQADVLALVR